MPGFFRSLHKAYFATKSPNTRIIQEGTNADLSCDLHGALWTKESSAPLDENMPAPLSYQWASLVITDSILVPANVFYHIMATANDVSGGWDQNKLYLLMGNESLSAGGDVLFSAPIPDGPGWLNVDFPKPFTIPLIGSVGQTFFALSATPHTYTQTPIAREAFINVAGGQINFIPVPYP
jgi:hypothetical protein